MIRADNSNQNSYLLSQFAQNFSGSLGPTALGRLREGLKIGGLAPGPQMVRPRLSTAQFLRNPFASPGAVNQPVYNFELQGGGVGAQGAAGATGQPGPPGAAGATGEGVPAAGTTGQVLQKASGDDYDTVWASIPGASGITAVNITNASIVLDYYIGNGVVDGGASVALSRRQTTITLSAGISGGNTLDIGINKSDVDLSSDILFLYGTCP